MSERIVFFDGVCNLCNEAVDQIVRYTDSDDLKVAPLQGTTARRFLNSEQIKNLESIIYYDSGKLLDKSSAALEISKFMRFPWKILYIFIIIPKFIRDPIYMLIAKNRYRLFGKKDSCRLPTASEKKHFLP